MHVEGLLRAVLYIGTLINSEQCSQFELFRLQHANNTQFQNKSNWQYCLGEKS